MMLRTHDAGETVTDQPTQPQDQPQGWQVPPPSPYPPPSGQYPPPGQYPYPPPGYVVYQPPPSYNLYAILSLVLGVMVLPPLGIYFGHKAKEQIAQTGERGIELAKVGEVVGWILTILYGLFFCFICVNVMGAFNTAARG